MKSPTTRSDNTSTSTVYTSNESKTITDAAVAYNCLDLDQMPPPPPAPPSIEGVVTENCLKAPRS